MTGTNFVIMVDAISFNQVKWRIYNNSVIDRKIWQIGIQSETTQKSNPKTKSGFYIKTITLSKETSLICFILKKMTPQHIYFPIPTYTQFWFINQSFFQSCSTMFNLKSKCRSGLAQCFKSPFIFNFSVLAVPTAARWCLRDKNVAFWKIFTMKFQIWSST